MPKNITRPRFRSQWCYLEEEVRQAQRPRGRLMTQMAHKVSYYKLDYKKL